MKPIYIALAAILITGTQAKAQEARRMSLEDCMEYAMKHNYTVKNAQLDVLIQKAVNDQTVAIALPQVSGKAEFNNFIRPQSQFVDASSFNFDPTVVIPKGNIVPITFSLAYGTGVSVSASQILFDGSVAVALQARNALMELSRQQGKVTESGVRYNVLKSYYSIIVIYNQLDILKNSLSYARQLQNDLERTQEAGFAEKIDVERTAVQINNLATDSARIANLAVLTEQVLKYQMGMDIEAPITLTDRNLDGHVESALKLLDSEKNYANVPEYNLTLTGLKLNEYNLKRYRMAALPQLIAIGSYGRNYAENNFNNVFIGKRYGEYSLFGLQLNQTIFSGFKRTKQIKETKLNIEKYQNNIESLKLGIDFQTKQAKTTLRNALLQLQSQKRNVVLADDVLDLAQKKYKAGVGSNSEVTQAQTEQLRAQNNYFSTMLDIINAEADLKKALGLL